MLGYKPESSLDQGIAKLVEWYQQKKEKLTTARDTL
jgi:nucleoside-diphosphate-sugar epimerase